jgi:hypothetical protein
MITYPIWCHTWTNGSQVPSILISFFHSWEKTDSSMELVNSCVFPTLGFVLRFQKLGFGELNWYRVWRQTAYTTILFSGSNSLGYMCTYF